MGVGRARGEAVERRRDETVSQRNAETDDEQDADRVGEGQRSHAEREDRGADDGELFFDRLFQKTTQQPALENHTEQADVREDIAHLRGVVAEALFAVEREERRHDRETGDGGDLAGEDRGDHAGAPAVKNFADRRAFFRTGAGFGGERFGKSERDERRVHQRKSGGEIERRGEAVVFTEDAADRWPDHESQPERRADEAHVARAIFFRGHVRDARHRGGNIAAARAVDDASEDEHPDRIRCTEDDEADRRADDADDEHRLAPDAIAPLSKQR